VIGSCPQFSDAVEAGDTARVVELLTDDARVTMPPLPLDDLADELRLIVFPVVVGDGERLFGETTDEKALRLLDTETLGSGLAHLTYAIVQESQR
jgi:hypothetical protein